MQGRLNKMTEDTKKFIVDCYKYSELMSLSTRKKIFSINKLAVIFNIDDKTVRKILKEYMT
jgi:hypothetical protein